MDIDGVAAVVLGREDMTERGCCRVGWVGLRENERFHQESARSKGRRLKEQT
jgi:hypothetical protein